MTDSSSVEGLEHWLTLAGFVFVGVTSLLAWASGSKEGSHLKAEGDLEASTSAVATAAGGAVYAGMIDSEAYKAVVEGLGSVVKRLDAIDSKMARLVEFGENQDEREERERQHQDIKEMMRGMIDDLRADMARGAERHGSAQGPIRA